MSRIPVTQAPSLLPVLYPAASAPVGRGGNTYIYEAIHTARGAAVSTSTQEVHLYEHFGVQPVRTIKYHSDKVTQIRVREESLMSSSRDGQIAIWDLRQASSAPSLVFKSDDAILSFDLSADSSVLVGGTQLNSDYAAKIQFWDPRAAGEPVKVFEDSHSDDVTQIHCNPNAPKQFLSGSTDGLLCTFDLAQPDEDDALQFVANTGASVSQCGYFGPDAQFVYVQSDMETLQLWTTEATQLADFGDVRELGQGDVTIDYIVKCKYDPGSQRLYMIAGNNGGEVHLLHVGVESMEYIQKLALGNAGIVRGFDWDLSDGWAVAGCEGGKLAWWSKLEQMASSIVTPTSAGPRRPGPNSRRFTPY
ncbi:hypothetical protein IWW46_001961 [Coemansia sp. RSA 2440]|nr:hypothetical protein LPJ67_002964 [Coemansia sp. RSA 1938]KAJ2444543.1 hypothetical protein IWW46_001961 [Coemansia sp. RSA 2440]